MANRLAQEQSPYLLQHAENPVDWYPWSDEAFAKAAAEDKPIFLSVGYSTCHWCHVMERESFEDEEVARLLNETFVCIKVDREERPDIDNIYMNVCSMMTGSGGWPLTIVMTADRKPFFAGTYFAKQTHYGRIGMLDLIPRLHEIWQTRRDEVLLSADKILAIVQEHTQSSRGSDLDETILHAAFGELSGRYDPADGGFSKAPKFPTPHNVIFLLRYWQMTGNEQALAMVEHSLTAMRLGGIFDHVGFGFHRYSTDDKWLLPHFEKMLYDQALLANAFLEAFQVTGNHLFAQTVHEIFTYVLRDLTDDKGGFYSAEDADSEGVEGKFYVWTIDDIKATLSAEQADFITEIYNIIPGGNFHDEATGTSTGANIFHLKKPLAALKKDFPKMPDALFAAHEDILHKLFEARKARIPPYKDDKILADWNGLMIGALAMGSRIFDAEKYLQAAYRAVNFILTDMRFDDRLMHRYRNGECAINGMLCDYAYLVWGLLELYAADFDIRILSEAIRLNEHMLDLFWDDQNGGFFLTAEDSEPLIIRPKEIYDGALPSGNSIALANLLRLEKFTGSPDLAEKARLLVQGFSSSIKETPSAYTQFLAGLHFALIPTTEIVIVGDGKAADTQAMLALLKKSYSSSVVSLFKDSAQNSRELTELASYTAELVPVNGKATAYVCKDFRCGLPVTDVDQLRLALGNV